MKFAAADDWGASYRGLRKLSARAREVQRGPRAGHGRDDDQAPQEREWRSRSRRRCCPTGWATHASRGPLDRRAPR
eukprot:4316228-Pyramimonas_sp.AAC.1